MSDAAGLIPASRVAFVKEAVLAVGPAEMRAADVALEVSALTGGITNELYRVKSTGAAPMSVVVRVYGKETERLICRRAEQFFQSKFLRTHGRHGDALVYEFLDDMRALEPDEMPAHADAVAACVADFHVRGSCFALVAAPFATQRPHSIHVMTRWLAVAEDAVANVPKFAGTGVVGPAGSFAALKATCARLLPLMARAQAVLPVVVCHNDLLGGNIMVERAVANAANSASSPPARVRFIDFEYARRDFALYDIANHWNEWAGYDNDFAKYPDAAAQRRFLRAYFAAMATLTAASDDERAAMLSDAAIERAVVATNFLSLAANLCWSTWSLVQHAYSAIDFDYMTYHKLKLERCLATLDAFEAPFIDLENIN